MIRTSKHILKFTNKNKLTLLDKIYSDCQLQVQEYLNQIISGKLELKQNLSSKYLSSDYVIQSHWKNICYNTAYNIIKSQAEIASDKRFRKYRKIYTKLKSKFSKKFNNKLQRWSYLKVLDKLSMLTEEAGINLIKVDPAYTSQTCSKCGSIHKESRNKERFKCIECGYSIDADYNASINILHRGAIFNPSTNKNLTGN
jgi:transposase